MEFLWKDYLSLAQAWANGADVNIYAKALNRSIISRTYYAVFHAALDVAEGLGMQTTRSASDHFRLRKFFETRGRVAAQLSHALSALYNLRIAADYEVIAGELVTDDPQAAAQKSLQLAEQALRAINHLSIAQK